MTNTSDINHLEEMVHEEILKKFPVEPHFVLDLCLTVAKKAFRLGVEAERKVADAHKAFFARVGG